MGHSRSRIQYLKMAQYQSKMIRKTVKRLLSIIHNKLTKQMLILIQICNSLKFNRILELVTQVKTVHHSLVI